MRRTALLVAVLLIAGCASSDPLTEAEVDDMNDSEASAMLQCQTQKVIDDKGQEAGMDHVAELWNAAIAEKQDGADGDSGKTVQVALSEEGYNCEELR